MTLRSTDAGDSAERAAGRPEAGQLSGDSGQLGEAEVAAAHIRHVIDDLGEAEPVYIRGKAKYPRVTLSAFALRALLAAAERESHQREAFIAASHEIEQTLGKALGYPELYPDASKVDDGAVCVGDHTAASLADEAAERIAKLQASLAERGAGAEAGPVRPRVVTLCGSTRFKSEFEQAMRDETLAGAIVVSVGLYGHLEGLDMDGPVKRALDELHLRKIDMADEVLVVNPGGYVGESTRREIDYAARAGKPVKYRHPQELNMKPPR